MGDWLAIYIAGCVVVVLLMLANTAFVAALDWILKGPVLRRNLKKIGPPDAESFWGKFGAYMGWMLFEAALSWVGVLIQIVWIPWNLIKILREAFTTVPQDIKQLRFPLHNNPDMSREAVWAYLRALEARAGGNLVYPRDLLNSVESVKANHEYFDGIGALKHLKTLNAVAVDAVDGAIARLEEKER